MTCPSRAASDTALAPRTIGLFTVTFCRNPLCASFSEPPALHKANQEIARGKIKGSDENRACICNLCGQGSWQKSNVALAEE